MAKKAADPDKTKKAPFETDDLRKNLAEFLDQPYPTAGNQRIGNFRWGVYAFFDYDGEPIYVGQTNELVRTRIRRHLTNQRTDAVAMSVLDPFEVFTIKVYPLPQYQDVTKGGDRKAEFKDAKKHLNALERAVHDKAIADSSFNAILNEKDPEPTDMQIQLPVVCEGRIVSEEVAAIRAHPDFRISRRALIISRLAQVISEREVKVGLRRVMLTQARRLEWLAKRRFEALGGEKAVPVKAADEEETDGEDDDTES
jgi:hypothetical protein